MEKSIDAFTVNPKTLKRLRLARLWTRHKLSVESGVSANTIWRIEAGYYETSQMRTIHKLAKALDVDPKSLLSSRPPQV